MSKGIELSMNFLVIMVITLVVFGLSISFIMNIYEKAKGMQAKTFEDLDKQIGYLRCGTEQVCVGEKTKQLRRGEFGVFGIRLLNVLNTRTKFKIYVRSSDINLDHKITLLPKAAIGTPDCGDAARCEEIDPDKSRDFALGVQVDKTTLKGSYVFDIYVQYEERIGVFSSYGETSKYKIIVNVP